MRFLRQAAGYNLHEHKKVRIYGGNDKVSCKLVGVSTGWIIAIP